MEANATYGVAVDPADGDYQDLHAYGVATDRCAGEPAYAMGAGESAYSIGAAGDNDEPAYSMGAGDSYEPADGHYQDLHAYGVATDRCAGEPAYAMGAGDSAYSMGAGDDCEPAYSILPGAIDSYQPLYGFGAADGCEPLYTLGAGQSAGSSSMRGPVYGLASESDDALYSMGASAAEAGSMCGNLGADRSMVGEYATVDAYTLRPGMSKSAHITGYYRPYYGLLSPILRATIAHITGYYRPYYGLLSPILRATMSK